MATFSEHLRDIRFLVTEALKDDQLTAAEVIQVTGEIGKAVSCVSDKLLDPEAAPEVAAEVEQVYAGLIANKQFDIPGVPSMIEVWLLGQVGHAIRPLVLSLLAKLREKA